MRKYKLIIGVLFILFFKYTNAQVNLLTDGSFEDTAIGWQNYWGEKSLNNWHTFDSNYYVNNFGYFSVFSTTFGFTLPKSFWYNINPFGYGAIDILLYAHPDPPFPIGTPNMRSIVRTKLSKKLTASKQYCFTYYAISPRQPVYLYSNGLQFYFDNGMLDTIYTIHKDSSGIYPFVQPQISSNALITDTNNWQKFQFVYNATGNEDYLTIGNFMSDSQTTIILPNWISLANSCRCHEILLDNVSLIPIDLHDWLHDTFCTIGDSVWVGLNQFDYSEGVWYNSNMQVIDTSTGFWYKPEAASTQFIQGVEVCGVMHYDTMNVYAYPLSNVQLSMNPNRVQLKVLPNPATNIVTISVNTLINQPVYISNTSGQIVVQQILRQPATTIDISQWASGVYVVRYANVVKKLVVQ